MSCQDFVDHVFGDPLPEHLDIPRVDYKSIQLDDPKYSWEYFGHDKFGRYAVCRRNNVRRGLTIGEFYGTSVVD